MKTKQQLLLKIIIIFTSLYQIYIFYVVIKDKITFGFDFQFNRIQYILNTFLESLASISFMLAYFAGAFFILYKNNFKSRLFLSGLIYILFSWTWSKLFLIINLINYPEMSSRIEGTRLYLLIASTLFIILNYWILILLKKIQSPSTFTQDSIEDNSASKFTRMLHFLIDTTIIWIVTSIYSYFRASSPENTDERDWIYYVYYILIFISYYIFSEMIFGRTIGKLITNTIVTGKEKDMPSKRKILIRTLLRLIPFEPIMFLFNYKIHDYDSGTTVRKIKTNISS